MNDLFEAFVAALLRRALAGSGIEVIAQGGRAYCLGEWREDADCAGRVFQTRPDILLRRGGRTLAVIDTKWKHVSRDPLDPKRGVSQSDVYQMMAYTRLYRSDRLMLLYPSEPGEPAGLLRRFGIDGGSEMLALAKLDVSMAQRDVIEALKSLAGDLLCGRARPRLAVVS